MEFAVRENDGSLLDATVDIEPGSIILHSRGGAKGSPNARNREYGKGLRLILHRLGGCRQEIVGAWVDSSRVRNLPLADRQILFPSDLPATSDHLFSLLGRRMESVGQLPGADPSKGNRNKRIRISLSGGSIGEIASVISAIPKGDFQRHLLRLPAEDLRRVTAEHIWRATLELEEGSVANLFGASQDYDLVTDTGRRLPPKAVFGGAASLALGFPVGPEHFSAGVGTPCFDMLEQAGYLVVRKDTAVPEDNLQISSDREWSEGNPRLLTHLRRERGRGLAAAKKSAFIREHGRLFCEQCGMDPVATFGDRDGEACIETHHREIAVADMGDGHRTRLEDLQCLCANCHRYVHRVMKRNN